ncbi:MAG: 30S ribosomal protein S2 [Candidatus Moranbacteria bacterium]|nr:30S ribosomal protein S2 [Candidatus Moranbacteria bacterium]MDZ4385261.1 30S ribosomal protein S2 [Candidatus Moranbacteria bacterium]
MTEEQKTAVAQEVAVEAGAKESASKTGSEDYFAGFDFANLAVDMNMMLKAGVHFGHQKSRRNPKMDEYIFGTRNGVNIIDLQKTVSKLGEAVKFIEKTVSEGQEILFVGTKKQVKKLVESGAKRCGAPYVIDRWLGGTFTNFSAISSRTRFLRDGEEKTKRGDYDKYTKFEQMKIAEELERLERRMGGIKNMLKLPAAIFVTGVIEDDLAIKEAIKRNIPIVAFVDTNVDPSMIDYPIPTNEDAVSALRLMMAHIVKAVLSGKEKAMALKNSAAVAAVKTESKN